MSMLRGAHATTFFFGLVVVCLHWAFTCVDEWGTQHDAEANVFTTIWMLAFAFAAGCWSLVTRDRDQANICQENLKRPPKAVSKFKEATQAVGRSEIVDPPGKLQAAATKLALNKLTQELWHRLKERNFEEALLTYDRVRNSIGDGSRQLWSLLLYSALQAKKLGRCEEFIQRLLVGGQWTGRDFVNIVRFHVQLVDGEGLTRNLSAMRRMGFQPDAISRNKALALCVEVGDFCLAEMLMEGTRSVSWDAHSYNMLIRLYGNCRQLSRCEELVAEMKTLPCKPNDFTYGSLIGAYIKSGDVDRAMEVLQELTDSGLQPNVVHYTTLLQGLVRCGRLDDAERLLDDMETRVATLDVAAYAAILSFYSKQGAYELALSLLQRMKNKGIELPYRFFITAFHACRNAVIGPGEILHLFVSLVGLGMRPDARMFSLAVKALVQAGGFVEALELVRDSSSRFGSELRPSIFLRLAGACHRAGRTWEAHQARALARAHRCSATFPRGADQGSGRD